MFFRFLKVNFPFTKGEGKRRKLSFQSTVNNFRATFRSPRYSFIASYDAKNELKMREQCLLWDTQAGMHQIGWPACNYTTFNMLVFPETLRSFRRSRRKIFFFLSEKKKKEMNWDLNIIYRNSLCITLKGFLQHKARFLLHNDQWPRNESACQSPWQMNHDRVF